MGDKPKKPSTYDMLKNLDKKVQQTKSQQKDDPYPRNSSNYKRRRSPSPRRHDSRRRRSRSDSPRRQDRRSPRRIEEMVIDTTDYDVPDRSFGDLYCKACDSHMNSEQMWEAHIQGKRHQKHIRKNPGDPKYEILYDEDPLILPEIKKATEPIIGLQHCVEIRRLEGKPSYQCYLCSANVPNGQLIMEHVVGLKHRMAYLKEHDPVKHDLIDKTNLKKGMIEPVVAECIRLHQDKHGTGIMQIKLDKTKPAVIYKKANQDNFDRDVKRDDRRGNYFDEREEEFRYERDPGYQRPHPYPEDRYEDRYPPLPPERDVPLRRYPDSHPMDRGAYERPTNYGRFTPPPSNQPSSSYTSSWLSNPTESSNNSSGGNLRQALEQRRETQNPSSNVNLFQSLLKIIETMPSMMFLEIVLHKVEGMDPTETELAMLQKIGNHMISFVMNRKLQKLSPDLLGKCQSNSKAVEEQSNKSTNNLNSLMNLVSQFNTAKASSPSFNWETQDPPPPDKPNNPAFVTQTTGSFYNSWGSSAAPTEIPGLTLSSSSTNEEEGVGYLPKTIDADDRQTTSSWSAASFRDRYGF